MTGEMRAIDASGRDSNGDEWPTHAYVARGLGCSLKPFDSYCGPYIDAPEGMLFLESSDGLECTAVLWPGGSPPALRAPAIQRFYGMEDMETALAAAKAVLDRLGDPESVQALVRREVNRAGRAVVGF